MRPASSNPACSHMDINKLKEHLNRLSSSHAQAVEDALKEHNRKISDLTKQVGKIADRMHWQGAIIFGNACFSLSLVWELHDQFQMCTGAGAGAAGE